MLDAFLELLLLLAAQLEVEFLDFDEDVALVEVVDEAEVTAGEGDLQSDPHVLHPPVPLDSRLKASNCALLVEGVDAPYHIALRLVESLDHLQHDALLGSPLLRAQSGQFVS